VFLPVSRLLWKLAPALQGRVDDFSTRNFAGRHTVALQASGPGRFFG
jgi:hypothetical protein